MNSAIDQELRDYHRQFNADHDRLRADLQSRLREFEPLRPQRAPRRRLWRYAASTAAAASLLAAVFAAMMLLGPQALYAKVLDSLKTVSTVQLTGTHYNERGEVTGTIHVWYDRQRGVREEEQRDGKKTYRLDNGKNAWYAKTDSDFVVCSASNDPLGLVRKALEPQKILAQAARRPQEDAEVNGAPCQCYLHEPSPGKLRARIWIDDGFHIRRFVRERRTGDAWKINVLMDARYDVAIDPSRFQADFVKGRKVLDSSASNTNFYSLENSVAMQEVMGLVVAVHTARRLSDRMLFVAYSVRPSKQTRDKYDPLPGYSNPYGNFELGSWRRLENGQEKAMHAMDIAGCCDPANGMQLRWSIVLLYGRWPAAARQFDFSGTLYTHCQLEEEHKKNGRPWFASFNPLMQVPLSGSNESLESAAADVYQKTLTLMPLTKAKKLGVYLNVGGRMLNEKEIREMVQHGVPEAEARKLGRVSTATPLRISLEGYQAAVKAIVKKNEPK
jgi:hypothetical protein